MTLLSIRNQIVGILLQKDSVSVSDFSGIKVPDDLADRREDLVRTALGTLCEAGAIRPVGNDLWILVSPLNAAGQDVHLSMTVCNEIADVLNTDLAAKEVDEQVDVLNIHEGHIVGLLQIINDILAGEE